MKAYKVSNLDVMGFAGCERYYFNPKVAEKEFYNCVRDVIENAPLASRDDLDGAKPWKIITRDPIYNGLKLKFCYSKWTSYNTDCGTEYDIVQEEIVLELIEIR